jgi:hypothetical protein
MIFQFEVTDEELVTFAITHNRPITQTQAIKALDRMKPEWETTTKEKKHDILSAALDIARSL